MPKNRPLERKKKPKTMTSSSSSTESDTISDSDAETEIEIEIQDSATQTDPGAIEHVYKTQIINLQKSLILLNNDRQKLIFSVHHLNSHKLQLEKHLAAVQDSHQALTKKVEELESQLSGKNGQLDPSAGSSDKLSGQAIEEGDLLGLEELPPTDSTATADSSRFSTALIETPQEKIQKLEQLLQLETEKSNKLLAENEKLSEMIAQQKSEPQPNTQDSGLSDQELETQTSSNLSEAKSVKTAKKAKKSTKQSKLQLKNSTKIKPKHKKIDENYNNPNNPDDLNSVLQSLAAEKVKTASLIEEIDNWGGSRNFSASSEKQRS